MDLFERLKQTHMDFLLNAEEAFLAEPKAFSEHFSKKCPFADMDAFQPLFQFADKLYCTSFVCSIIQTYSPEDAATELTEIKKDIIAAKRVLKRNIRNGAYDEAQKRVNADLGMVDAWLSNSEIFSLSEFAFFGEVRPTTKAKYYLDELLYYSYIILSGKEDVLKDFVQYPTVLADLPFFMVGSTKIPDHFIDAKKGTMSIYLDNMTTSGAMVRTIFDDVPLPDCPTDEEIEEILSRYTRNKALDKFDQSVFICLYNMINVDICAHGFLTCTWKDFVSRLFPQRSGKELADAVVKYRKKIEHSILKFKEYKITIQTSDTKENGQKGGSEITRAYNLMINEFTGQEKQFRIDFSNNFLQNWLSEKTEKVIRSEYEQMSPSAKPFIFYLQNKRALSKSSGYKATIDLAEMLTIFPGIRKDKFLKEVKDALGEYKIHHTLIENYEIKSPYLKITFIPLSESEAAAYSV